MKKLKREFVVDVTAVSELSAADQALLEAAHKAAKAAYAPYSSFRVGAAVRLASGKIVTGSNQENMAYPSGTQSIHLTSPQHSPTFSELQSSCRACLLLRPQLKTVHSARS